MGPVFSSQITELNQTFQKLIPTTRKTLASVNKYLDELEETLQLLHKERAKEGYRHHLALPPRGKSSALSTFFSDAYEKKSWADYDERQFNLGRAVFFGQEQFKSVIKTGEELKRQAVGDEVQVIEKFNTIVKATVASLDEAFETLKSINTLFTEGFKRSIGDQTGLDETFLASLKTDFRSVDALTDPLLPTMPKCQ